MRIIAITCLVFAFCDKEAQHRPAATQSKPARAAASSVKPQETDEDRDKDGQPDCVDLCHRIVDLGCEDGNFVLTETSLDISKSAVEKLLAAQRDPSIKVEGTHALARVVGDSVIAIEADTNPRGLASRNRRLSRDWAEAVAYHLRKRDVDLSAVPVVGFGESRGMEEMRVRIKLRASNCRRRYFAANSAQ